MEAAVSARDPRVLRAAALLREPGDALTLDGPELIEAAVAEGLPLELILARDPEPWTRLAPTAAASPDALRALGALGQPAEVVAIAARPRPGRAEDARLVLASVRDAGNVGSILRTAVALGGEKHPTGTKGGPTLAVQGTTADPFSRRALRASAGAALRAGLVADVANLHDIPHPLAAAVPRGGIAPAALPPEAVVVLGNERDGLSPAERAACEFAVTIEADGFESLNVAAAAAILLWELRSRR